jgi:hypothetical protein
VLGANIFSKLNHERRSRQWLGAHLSPLFARLSVSRTHQQERFHFLVLNYQLLNFAPKFFALVIVFSAQNAWNVQLLAINAIFGG